MTRLPVKIVGGVVAAAIVVGLWAFFAPTKLGGSTTFAVTSGISMEPLLHKNDLAFVRARSSYHVGEVVLYHSSTIHRSVLHRIIVIQHGKYYFKGDNNGFVDPGYATRSELVGVLWFKVPAVGSVLSWFGKPFHAALLAGLATMVIVLAGVTTTKSRRRRRRGPKPMIAGEPSVAVVSLPIRDVPAEAETSPGRAYKRRPPAFLDGPTSTLVALGVVLALALAMLGMGFSRPEQRPGVLSAAYHQAGTFSYSATTTAANAVYPGGVVKTGDPIYPSLVDIVSLRFGYRFTSGLAHHIRGTIELRGLVLSQNDTWQALSTVAPITKFLGDTTVIQSDLSLADLYTFIDSVSTQSGIAGANYSVDIQPVVHVTGTVGKNPIDVKFSPVLPFAVSKSAIRVDVAAAAPPPGATYIPPAAGTALLATLHPTQPGSVPHLVANDVSVAKYKIGVSVLRGLGIAFIALALGLALVHDRRRRRRPRRSEEELIADRLHALIVPVASLASSSGRTLVAVPDFASLAGLARFLERPILYEVRDGTRTFAVDDDALRYVTAAIDRRASRPGGARSADADGPAADAAPTPTVARAHRAQVPKSSTRHGPTKRAIVVRAGAVLLVLAVGATLTLSLTASTTVPASRVGQSFHAGDVSQGTPAGCSALALTSLVMDTGTFSNSASHVLILGGAGVDKITDTGQSNCIVAGGGKDTVTGTSSDVCIIGPTTGATYTKCTKRSQ